MGEEHARYATALCQELRDKLRVNAYVHSYQHHIDGLMSDEEANQFGVEYGIRPRRRIAQTEPPVNWVVLVGDFKSFDDPAAHKTLDRIRKLDVKSVPSNVWDQYGISLMDSMKGKGKKAGPLNTAMLVPNPHPEAPKFEKQISEETRR